MSRPGYDMEIEHPQGIQMSHVFLIVLALHVLVIGGALGYHWMRGRLGDDKSAVAKDEKAAVAPEGAGPKVAFRTGGFEPAAERPLPLEERRVRPVDRERMGLDAMRLAQGRPATEQPAAAPGAQAPQAPLSVVTAVASVPLVTPPPKVVAPQPVQQIAEHTVGKGEVLGKIAKKHGVSVAALREANGLRGDLIRIGQKLKIPVRQAAEAAPTQVAAKAPTPAPAPTRAVAQAAVPAAAAPQAAKPSDAERVYVVSKGDTLWGISKRFKMAPENIARANKLSDPGRLKIGMKLVIPLDMSGNVGEPKKAPASEVSSVAMSG